mgnify:CR=1 FL=1|jgi:transcriptional regulator, XRE family|uniref:Helix-turn-helix domain protein n=1 Tax=Siphoviridae sp. ctwQT14 TaxID=2827971 RepID=A0A8S5TJQ9_9CAUD|nr:MAG TPA: helix-turn-helix domain protein [Siphoviridae sp. ctwQT14]
MENTATNKLVGTKIKELRVLDGLTQKQLADELSISDKHLSKIENGHKSASTALIDKLCTIFKKTPAYFFAGKDIADEIDANRAINAIVEDLKVASISDLKIISKVVKDIIYK